MNDLLSGASTYDASSIEVLEGLEPVRKRPGMYIGGTDENALHHLASEIIDNAMDEAVAGHADRIEVTLEADNWLMVRDNGRGIPVDPHPKFPKLSALEVILTTLHSGGKFSGKAYDTSGGLHGVGSSVVNALSERMEVEVARDRTLFTQVYSRGKAITKLKDAGAVQNRRGTTIRFKPDPEIFAKQTFRPERLYRFCRSKAYLYRGVEIRWACDPALIKDETPAQAVLHFPGGLSDFLTAALEGRPTVVPAAWSGDAEFPEGAGRVEWAASWVERGDGFLNTYANTIPTPQGGTHEAGFRAALVKGLRAYGELKKEKRAANITAEDLLGPIAAMLSVFIREPQFQGQTKDRLTSPEAARLVEMALRDHFDHWLTGDPAMADNLLAFAIERAEDRLRRRAEKDTPRKTATRKLRLPGKLSDCARESAEGRVIAVVQPHRFTRLGNLMEDFQQAFNDADMVFVTPVYAAGEAPIEGVSAEALVEGLQHRGHRSAATVADADALAEALAGIVEPKDQVICLGAGDITKWAAALAAAIEAKR